jgi:endonuclease G
MKRIFILIASIAIPALTFAQLYAPEIRALEKKLETIYAQEKDILGQLEDLKLRRVRHDLKSFGLPKVKAGETVIEHSAMSLVYDEEHEQAKWVAHIITPDIIDGDVSRSNDFRPDPKVVTGTCVEEDYFLKYLQPDSSYVYDGYGFDRGHLAPSADFRWSEKALSESYFYSNMSPQVADFNRGKWAELEGMIRGYVYRNKKQLYVVSGPILKPDLPKSERSINKVSVPELYFKVVLDLENQRAIGFIMPNKPILYPIESFAVSIDKVEEETGLDFFPALSDLMENNLEAQKNIKEWLPPAEMDDVAPIYAPSLPPGHFNTVQAKRYEGAGREVSICGTVVSTKLSKKGNVFLNLDKKFPNQIFSVTIWKDYVPNFSYEPHKELMSKEVCVHGKVRNFNGVSTMDVQKEEQIYFLEEAESVKN